MGDVDDAESIRAVHCALDRGINFLDTANVYGAGHSERVLATALKGRRNHVILATKFGYLADEATKQALGESATPDSIREQCDESLRRLNTDVIDLLQFHLNEFELQASDTVRDVLEELVAAGKIRAYGWSTDDPVRAERFAKGAHCVAVQCQLNVLDDNRPMIALAERIGITCINRGPLAMGLLSGKYGPESMLASDDIRGTSPEWLAYFETGKPSSRWLSMLDAIREILCSEGRSLVQGALAWLWGRSDRNLPIPGFRTVAQVEENCQAMLRGPLKPHQMEEIRNLLTGEGDP